VEVATSSGVCAVNHTRSDGRVLSLEHVLNGLPVQPALCERAIATYYVAAMQVYTLRRGRARTGWWLTRIWRAALSDKQLRVACATQNLGLLFRLSWVGSYATRIQIEIESD
jgi:hypothetical protein